MADSESLVGLPATEIAARVRAGDVKPTEVVAQHLARIEALDAQLNAFQMVRADRAMQEARALEARADLSGLVLAGVPVAIKDQIDVAGEPTRLGSAATSAAPAASDDPLVRRMRDAGCVVVGKTRVPELMAWPFTESEAFGVTRNPWDPSRVPGGSSGGSSAAVAAGMVPIAHGADGGGSIRIPAACCGVFGIKPGAGVVAFSGDPWDNWYGLAEHGPLATTVADAALMLDVLAGSTTLREVETNPAPMRIALSLRSAVVGVKAPPEVCAAVRSVAKMLGDSGHRVTPADPPYPATIAFPFIQRWLAGSAQAVRDLSMAALEPRTRQMVRLGRAVLRFSPPTEKTVAGWKRVAARWFESFDVALMPVLGALPEPVERWKGCGFARTMMGVTPFVPYTEVWNLAGYPCASVPAGQSEGGLPIGIQIVAPSGGEARILALAAQIERMRPWPRTKR